MDAPRQHETPGPFSERDEEPSTGAYLPRPAGKQRLWSPFFLRRAALVVFITFFIILMVVIAILFSLSNRKERLSSANPRLYYLWVYGPTAVFTFLTALWTPLDYRVKQMAPWVLMAKGFQPARDSLLLDYTDQINVASFYNSLRRGHWLVFFTIAGLFLIQIATVVSSGLFVSLETTVYRVDTPVTARDAFSASVLSAAGSKPATSVYGVVTSNLSYPFGTIDRFAFQLFDSPNAADSQITALVDVFESDLSCEVANITEPITRTKVRETPNTLPDVPSSGSAEITQISEKTEADITLDTPSCSNLSISVIEGRVFAYNGSTCGNIKGGGEKATRFVVVWGDWLAAESAPDDLEAPSPSFITLDPSPSFIILGGRAETTTLTKSVATTTSAKLGAATVSTKSSSSTKSTASGSKTATSKASSPTLQLAGLPTFVPSLALVCTPSYSIRKKNVELTQDANGHVQTYIPLDEGNGAVTNLPNITSWDILTEFVRSITESRKSLSLDMAGFIDTIITSSPTLARRSSEAQKEQALSKLFRLTTAQLANTYLKTPEQALITGTTKSQEPRLVVSVVSFWIMEALLLLLTLIAGYLFFKSTEIAAPSDPSTIAGLATVLANSKTAVSKLEDAGNMNEKLMGQLLEGDKFRTDTVASADNDRPIFRIEELEAPEAKPLLPVAGSPDPGNKQSTRASWYQPFAVTITGRVLILAVFPAMVVTLELLYRRSVQDDGLARIVEEDTMAHYAWTYVPTAVMVGLSLLLAALSSSVKLLSPYHSLRKGEAPANKSIAENQLRSVAVVSLWQASRNRKWAAVAAGLAAMLAPLLTIVVSGLLVTEPYITSDPARFQRLDTFNPNTTDISVGLRYANMVLANNLSDPLWTYQDLALPHLSDPSENNVPITAITYADIEGIPALRGRFNCTVATLEQLNCSADNPGSHASVGQLDGIYSKQNLEFNGTGYFGKMIGLKDQTGKADCPSIMVSFGHVLDSDIDAISYLACEPFVETVRVSAKFQFPSWELNVSSSSNEPTQPPAVVIDPKKYTNPEIFPSANLTDFLSKLMDASFANPAGEASSVNEDLGSMFPLVVYGRKGAPIADFTGADNTTRLIDAVESTFQIVMAQILNYARQPYNQPTVTTADDGSPETLISGTVIATNKGQFRLKQSPVSTRILEGLLGFMFVCVILTYALQRHSRRLLPKNPCSIAAMASLVAGSELLENIPPGAEWMSDEERRKAGVWEGMVFSLDWWAVREGRGGEGARRRFGIDFERVNGGRAK